MLPGISKTLVWIGADMLSYWGLIGSAIGGLLGIWAGVKLSQYL